MQHFFKKIPNTRQYPIGIEWTLFKRMPLIFLIGTLCILTPACMIYLQNTVMTAAQYQIIYVCFGALFTFWFFVGVLAIGCFLMIIMKGPAYVADAYNLPKEDKNLEAQDN